MPKLSPLSVWVVVFPPLLVVACALFGVEARTEFYELSAQVLPVLLLVAAVEGRMFRVTAAGTTFAKFYRAYSLGWILLGETAALAVAGFNSDTGLAFGLVLTGYAMALASAIVYMTSD